MQITIVENGDGTCAVGIVDKDRPHNTRTVAHRATIDATVHVVEDLLNGHRTARLRLPRQPGRGVPTPAYSPPPPERPSERAMRLADAARIAHDRHVLETGVCGVAGCVVCDESSTRTTEPSGLLG